MEKRYLYIWFKYLLTDWLLLQQPRLQNHPVAFVQQQQNRVVIHAVNAIAERHGIHAGMLSADAKAVLSEIKVFTVADTKRAKLLRRLGLWCIGYTPFVALDLPDGLILDITGCAHLKGGEEGYLQYILDKLTEKGFKVRATIADSIGSAWAGAHYSSISIIPPQKQIDFIKKMPPASLRLTPETLERLQKLGFFTVESLMPLSPKLMRQRCGEELPTRLAQAMGLADEHVEPIASPILFVERLSCLEPIRTAPAIAMAIETLLQSLCERLEKEGKGLRKAILKYYRIDGKMGKVQISTNKATHLVPHLIKLFDLQIAKIAPGLGIELLVLEGVRTEAMEQHQEKLWHANQGLQDKTLVELLDRIVGKMGDTSIHRYLPLESYWPEHSYRKTYVLEDKPATHWLNQRPRPMHLLQEPVKIQVMAIVPDYPPVQFRLKDKIHQVAKADGPERIEYEWWRSNHQHRDYYVLEDVDGQRYWVFRLGHYNEVGSDWYLHGYFA